MKKIIAGFCFVSIWLGLSAMSESARSVSLSDLSDYLLPYIAHFVEARDAAAVRKTCRRMRYSFWDPSVAVAVDEHAQENRFIDEYYWFAILAKALVAQNLIQQCKAYNSLWLRIKGGLFLYGSKMPVEWGLLLTSLRRLIIKETNLQASSLSNLSMITGLRELRLSDLRNANQDSLSFISKLTELVVLDLSDNELVWLPSMAGLKKLVVLIVCHNRLETQAIESLSSLTMLQQLDLSYNGRMDHVSEAITHLSGLKKLDLRGCIVPDRDRENLNNMFLPRITILFSTKKPDFGGF